eukprot:4162218-Amphidinium_carterae.1
MPARCKQALARFFLWRRLRHGPLPQAVPLLDAALCEFANELWHDGEPKHILANALSAFHHFLPHLRGHLPGVWRLHSAWVRVELNERAFSLTRLMVEGMAE